MKHNKSLQRTAGGRFRLMGLLSGPPPLSSIVRHFYVVGDFVAPDVPAGPFAASKEFEPWPIVCLLNEPLPLSISFFGFREYIKN